MPSHHPVILIVDDFVTMRRLLRNMLRHLGCGTIVEAPDGATALQIIQQRDIHLVIADVNMPHMSGLELLQAIRTDATHHGLPVLLITGEAGTDSVVQAARLGVNGYIVKPFTPHTLLTKIRRFVGGPFPTPLPLDTPIQQADPERAQAPSAPHRVGTLVRDPHGRVASAPPQGHVIQDVVRRFHSGQAALPVFPQTVCTILEQLKGQDAEADLPAIEHVLAADPLMTASLMRIANSAYYRRGARHLQTLKEAILRLGLRQTLNQVFLLAYRGLFRTEAPLFQDIVGRLWDHAFATGACARILAQRFGCSNPDVYFTLGLLHDIGHLVLVQLLRDMAQEGTEVTDAVIHRVFQTLHEECGAFVLAQWHFPASFTTVALYHHAVSRAEEITTELLVVHFANLLVRQLGYSLTADDGTDLAAVESARQLGLHDASIRAIAAEVQDYVEALKPLM